MAMVSDRSLADLCLELNQSSSPIPLPLIALASNGEEVLQSVPSSHSSSLTPSPSEDQENPERDEADHVEKMTTTSNDHQNQLEDRLEGEEPKEEEEEEDGKYLTFEEFKRQSEELTSYLENFKAMKLEREREEEVSQIQSYQEEKIAALSELDHMVSFIHHVKTTFTPPEKEKPLRKENVRNAKKLSSGPFVGKGKYATKGNLNHQSSDDPDSTRTTVSTSQYTPREQDQEEDDSFHGSPEEDEEDDDGQYSERTSLSDESEVSLSYVSLPTLILPSTRSSHTHKSNSLHNVLLVSIPM